MKFSISLSAYSGLRKSTRVISLLLLFSAAFFTACERENLDEIIVEDPNYQPGEVKVNNLFSALRKDDATEAATMNCVTLEYPFELELQSGNKTTINSKSALEAALDEAATDRAVDFVFPLIVVDASGDKETVNSNRELAKDYASCLPQQGWAKAMATNETLPACLYSGLFCFDLVYPIDLIDEAGNPYSVATEDELIDLLVTTESELSFLLPISVVDEEGNEITLENLDDFFNVSGACDSLTPVVVGDGFEFQGFVCYQLVYPVEMLDADGNAITVNNADEYANLVLGGAALELQFPFSLVNTEGETLLIDDIDAFILALNACGFFEIIITPGEGACGAPGHVLIFINQGGTAMSPCRFSVNYPVVLEAGGTTFVVNDIIAYYDVYNAYQLNEIEVIYPVSVTVNSTGEVIEFTEDAEVCAYIDDCE